MIKKFVRWFQRRKQKLLGIPLLQNYTQQQDKFKKKYPYYAVGLASYGFPKIYPAAGYSLSIGSFCSIAGGVQIFLGSNHRSDWISTYPFPAFFPEASHNKEYEKSRGDVIIGNDVWLCANCTILSGVTIGHGAVVGAGAVVTKNVEPYAIVAGNPAKTVRFRFDELTRKTLLDIAWWDWPLEEIRTIMNILCSDQIEKLIAYSKSRVA